MTTAERLEQLRDLPLVTAADRERYKQWEQEARVFLQFNEPRETYFRRDVDTSLRLCGSVPMTDHSTLDLDEWRSHWRSLPDYDGPPMRAPSGPVFVLKNGFLCPPNWPEASSDLGITQEPDSMRRHPDRHIGWALWYLELKAWDDPGAYKLPSTGGRGWCPKLAGVSE